MLDVEVLNRRGKREQRVTDLLDGRKLPIWFSAWDIYQKSSPVWKYDAGGAIIELYMCFIVFPEVWCTVNEMGESCAVKIDLIEKSYIQSVEPRGVDVGHEFV
jgi:hypothetical protein